MRDKQIKQKKYRNSGILFELLIRQITSETITGLSESPALNITKKYFNAGTELGKELQLYRAFFEVGRPLTEGKAIDYVNMIIEQRRKLDESKLTREKYNLVKEIKENYSLDTFLSHKIPNYTLHASVYKVFMNEVAQRQKYNIINVNDIATAKYTIVEHLTTPQSKKPDQTDTLIEEYRKESEDLRLVAYKMAIDKFNEKYSGLNESQKLLLREYINNTAVNQSLLKFMSKEVPVLQEKLRLCANSEKNKVAAIKLNEVANQLEVIRQKKVFRDNEVTAVMIAFQILKESE